MRCSNSDRIGCSENNYVVRTTGNSESPLFLIVSRKLTRYRVTLSIFHLCSFLIYYSLHYCPSPVSIHSIFSQRSLSCTSNLPITTSPPIYPTSPPTYSTHGKHPTPQNSLPLHYPPLLPHRPPPRSQQRNSIRDIRPLTNLRLYNRGLRSRTARGLYEFIQAPKTAEWRAEVSCC